MAKIEHFARGSPGNPVWRCFSCGRRLKTRRALYGHLAHCYWYQAVYKNKIEESPFYHKIPSRQLRYYVRNRAKVNKQRRAKYKEDHTQETRVRLIKLPATLRKRRSE